MRTVTQNTTNTSEIQKSENYEMLCDQQRSTELYRCCQIRRRRG